MASGRMLARAAFSSGMRACVPSQRLSNPFRGIATAAAQEQQGAPVQAPSNHRPASDVAKNVPRDTEMRSGSNNRGMSRRMPRDAFPALMPGGAFDLWSPLSTSRSMRQMMDTVNRLFDTDLFFPGAGAATGAIDQPMRGGAMRTPWDIVEKEDAYYLRIDMPGFDKSDLHIHVEDDEMVIKAERSGSDDDLFETQRSVNTRMSLPQEARKEQIKAELKNGVLTIVVPKEQVPEEKRRMVVNVE